MRPRRGGEDLPFAGRELLSSFARRFQGIWDLPARPLSGVAVRQSRF
jgi:hypothetical protein